MTHKISEKQMAELKEAFTAFDKNGDGKITAGEIEDLLKTMGLAPSKEEIKDMLNELDIDQNGCIDFSEFVTMMTKDTKTKNAEEEMLEAFKMFDKDGNGNISATELKQVMTNLGEKLSDSDIDLMIKQADIDGDGQINYGEFVKMMKSGDPKK